MTNPPIKPNSASVMTLADGTTRAYGSIEERNGNLLFYTGKGLREIFRPVTDEEKAGQEALQSLADLEAWDQLKASGHVDEVPLVDIVVA